MALGEELRGPPGWCSLGSRNIHARAVGLRTDAATRYEFEVVSGQVAIRKVEGNSIILSNCDEVPVARNLHTRFRFDCCLGIRNQPVPQGRILIRLSDECIDGTQVVNEIATVVASLAVLVGFTGYVMSRWAGGVPGLASRHHRGRCCGDRGIRRSGTQASQRGVSASLMPSYTRRPHRKVMGPSCVFANSAVLNSKPCMGSCHVFSAPRAGNRHKRYASK